MHIYRLVTSSSIEENILKKAQQKRHLDFLGEREKKKMKKLAFVRHPPTACLWRHLKSALELTMT